jgi:hypothetical protein
LFLPYLTQRFPVPIPLLLRRCNRNVWHHASIATIPLCAFAIAAALRKPHPPWDFTALLLELALWVLIPVSIWWWILFTRKCIRAQFH